MAVVGGWRQWKRRPARLAAVLASLAMVATGIAATQVDAAPVEATLMASTSATLASPKLLNQATLSGKAFAFVGPKDAASGTVRYYLDGTASTGRALRANSAGAVLLNAATLKSGTHTLRAVVATDDGGNAQLLARFRVRNPGTAGNSGTQTAGSAGRATKADPLEGAKFYGVNTGAAEEAAKGGPDAALFKKMADIGAPEWLTGGEAQGEAEKVLAAAAKAKKVPVMVMYNIPGRDCGLYSSGGAGGEGEYTAWVEGIAKAIGKQKTVVILEPDALPAECTNEGRFKMISAAVDALAKQPGAITYIDAGHSSYGGPPEAMAEKLKKSGVAKARGFALNVSNFHPNNTQVAYGKQIVQALGGKSHFVVDSSRNGNGLGDGWCNPQGRALGTPPTTKTGDQTVDAFLYIKTPGQSDGSCGGAPSAGTWWPEYAKGLAERAKF